MWKPSGLSIVLLFVLTACVTPGLEGVPSGGPDLIVKEQIEANNSATAYQVVESLRPNWLRVRGKNGYTLGAIQVYVDNLRVGGTGVLHQLASSSVYSIRWYDGITASGRWGLDHGNGVIYVLTLPSPQ